MSKEQMLVPKLCERGFSFSNPTNPFNPSKSPFKQSLISHTCLHHASHIYPTIDPAPKACVKYFP